MSAAAHPTKDDVLDAFAMESEQGRSTLERYLQTYPQFAKELIELSREIMRTISDDDDPLSPAEITAIDEAWIRYSSSEIRDPLALLTPNELRQIAEMLGIPRQVMTAFREHKVILSTVPRGFLARFAEAAKCSLDILTTALSLPKDAVGRAYKADQKPNDAGQISFERLLKDAQVPEDRLKKLMSEVD